METSSIVRLGFRIAKAYESMSKDPSTQVGCAILNDKGQLLTAGYNGLPRGIAESAERAKRPAKYLWTEHAERNAIFNAAGLGSCSLRGGILFVTSLPPCARCMRGIIQVGIVAVHYSANMIPAHWLDDMLVSSEMASEAGVLLYGHDHTSR